MTFTTDELRTVTILEGLPEEPLAWLADHGERIDLAAGDRVFERGQPADFMYIVVGGTIQRFEEIGGQWLPVATTRQGEVTGMLPFSRMTHYPGNTVATEPSRVLRVRKTDIPELLRVSEELGRRLVAVMSDRVRGDVRLEQQRERMAALGRLSAGLAHEINNPAAAVRRAAASLSEQLATLSDLVLDLVRHEVDEAAIAATDELRQLVRGREPPALSPLERGELEDALQTWLEGRGVARAWETAGTFADEGLSLADLETFAGGVSPGVLGYALAWVGGVLSADRTVAEIASSSARISELIASVKIYSHMDRSPEHKPVDVREGLDNTLTMLGHKLKKKSTRLARDYSEDLPPVAANAGELNQVWTNLIDNAIDAIDDDGELRVEARQEEAWVTVRVIDTGTGIPEEVRPRIFEPFFTTKGVGEGTGLGLDIAMRIVRTHQGHIDVQSRPGRTEMCVRLPVSPAPPAAGPTGS
ncbi:MAG: cyclic nucleotide-binding domain-containing protein [Acidobacteria bacterium]|nr:cyclic nucleotide-binding domain-containing protein [Acidobacteriota bacterium]